MAGVYSNSFAYDGKLRRRIETDYSWNGSSWTQTNETLFVYDGNVVIQKRNGSDTPEVTYTRGDDLSGTLQGAGGIGGFLARTDYGQEMPGSPTTAYYHADGNGNVTMLLYTNGIIAAKYLYDPYGNTLSLSGPLANLNTYRFSSKEWNTSSGLYYYLYRFYDPNLQRWVNRDPLGEQGGINLYQFDANNSITGIDDIGLQSWMGPGYGAIPTGPYGPINEGASANAIGASDLALTAFGLGDFTQLSSGMMQDVVNDSVVQKMMRIWLDATRLKWKCCKSGVYTAHKYIDGFQPLAGGGTSATGVDWAWTGGWQLYLWGEFHWQCGASSGGKCRCHTTGTIHGNINKTYTFIYSWPGSNPFNELTTITEFWPFEHTFNISHDFTVYGTDSGSSL